MGQHMVNSSRVFAENLVDRISSFMGNTKPFMSKPRIVRSGSLLKIVKQSLGQFRDVPAWMKILWGSSLARTN